VSKAFGRKESEANAEDGYEVFVSLLSNADAHVRIRAYHVLAASFSTSAIIPSSALSCLISSFRFLYDDADAHERGEILSVTRRLLKRLQSSAATLHKKEGMTTSAQIRKVLKSYADFSTDYYGFLKKELVPQLSYQRHILALQTFPALLQIDLPDISLKTVAAEDIFLIKALLNLVTDPFEDVRSTASGLLENISTTKRNALGDALQSADIVRKANALSSSTSRGDHADAAGRFVAISAFDSAPENKASEDVAHVSRSHETLLNNTNLLEHYLASVTGLRPTTDFPLHAMLLSIVYMLQNVQTRHGRQLVEADGLRIVAICRRIWHLVHDQLCVDSPETATNEEVEDIIGGPKDLLAYSWRALRDSRYVE